MKKIGEGYYYNVYNLDNERVFKKQKSLLKIIFYIFKANIFMPNSFIESYKAISSIRNIKENYDMVFNKIKDKSKIGNPVFLGGIDYEQDIVITLDNIIKEGDLENSKKYIDKYIELVKYFWSCGVHENVYNFTVNSGVKNKNVVMIDFNEVSFNIEKAKKSIENKVWLKRYSYFCLKGDLKKYYKKRMDEEMTIENLYLLWNKN